MSKPKWADIIEGQKDPSTPRMAVAYQRGPDGKTRVTAAGQGSAAEEIVRKAEEAGLPIGRDPERLRRLLQAEGEDSRIPPEIYELMSIIINFSQELNETWIMQHEDT
ncbi:MAG: EscU/YscU/HrcU family type III secretion system export apparatus switch protein [Armatimonadetes bacterium]|nr:EscU/YscU/HrcU family type III secretion system export apparatus switch protein [Armatimonadota bacterium]